jgi:hypothetical protein
VGLGALVGFLVSKAPGPRRYQLGRKRNCWETKIAMDNDSFIDDLFDLIKQVVFSTVMLVYQGIEEPMNPQL